jgi:CRISPR/Cas system-associated exonuclease Cas4 (RecB family)
MRTSYSALDTFRHCPQKFKFQIVDKRKAPKTPEAVFGNSVHGALKFMFSRDPLFPTIEEVSANFSEHWRSSSQKAGFERSLLETYEESGRSILKKFYSSNPPWNFSVVDTESHFEVPLQDLDGSKTHILAGIIDRIDKIGDGEYEIIDYKTNRKLPSQSTVDADLQMSIYHMALMSRWPNIDPAKIRLSLYFLKHNEKLSSVRSMETLSVVTKSVFQTIRSIQKNIKDNIWKSNVSTLCDWCAYKSICPAWKHLYKTSEVLDTSETELQSALREYFLIKENETKNEQRLVALQTTIKSYMDTRGVERVFDERGYFVAKKVLQRFHYDVDAVRDIFLLNGLEEKWQDILSADEKKLKGVLKSLPSFVQAKIF